MEEKDLEDVSAISLASFSKSVAETLSSVPAYKKYGFECIGETGKSAPPF